MLERLTPRLRNVVLTASIAGGGAAALGLSVFLGQIGTDRTDHQQLPAPFDNGQNPFPVPRTPNDRRGRLETRVEERFGITLLDREEWQILNGRVRVKPAEVDWDPKKLALLEGALSQFPGHFYEDQTLVIEPFKRINASCVCIPGLITSDGSIHINKGVFKQNVETVLWTMAHESAHSIQPWITDNPGSQDYKDYTSPWVTRRDEILGGDPILARNRILATILRLRPNAWGLNVFKLWGKEYLSGKEKKDLFAARLIYGLGFPGFGRSKQMYDTEFFAVMAETFIQGPEDFFGLYEDYLKPREVEDFYAFTRDEIFNGWEYRNGVAISQPLEDRS